MAVIKLSGSRRITQLFAGSDPFPKYQPKISLWAQSGGFHE
jgi:hypothetical protein